MHKPNAVQANSQSIDFTPVGFQQVKLKFTDSALRELDHASQLIDDVQEAVVDDLNFRSRHLLESRATTMLDLPWPHISVFIPNRRILNKPKCDKAMLFAARFPKIDSCSIRRIRACRAWLARASSVQRKRGLICWLRSTV